MKDRKSIREHRRQYSSSTPTPVNRLLFHVRGYGGGFGKPDFLPAFLPAVFSDIRFFVYVLILSEIHRSKRCSHSAQCSCYCDRGRDAPARDKVQRRPGFHWPAG